jgi:hypothetical protein
LFQLQVAFFQNLTRDREFLLGFLAGADIADRRRYQCSLSAHQRTQHDLDGKFSSIIPPPREFDTRADVLCQRLYRASCSIRDQAFRKPFRNYFLNLLANEFVAPVAKLFLDLYIHQDNLPSLVYYHHCIRGCFQ